MIIFLAGSNKNNRHSEEMSNSHSLPDDTLPLKFQLSQNYPNPFRDKTVIKYCVAYKTKIQITIYDLGGKEIEKLVDEEKKPGTYEVEFHMTEIQKAESRKQKAVCSGQLAMKQKTESGKQKAVGSGQLAIKQKAEFGRHLKDGEYVYRMKAGDFSCEKKMIIMR